VIYLFGGVGLAVFYLLVALATAAVVPVEGFAHIAFLCEAIDEGPVSCRDGAVAAGVTTAVGLLIALVIAAGLMRPGIGAGSEPPPRPQPRDRVIAVFSVAVVMLLIGHIAHDAVVGSAPTRYDALRTEGGLISVENLIWPLLIQVMVYQRGVYDRLFFLAILTTLAALSPFRGVLLAILVFGLVLPLADQLIGPVWRARGALAVPAGLRGLVSIGVVAVAAIALLAALYAETRLREQESASYAGSGPFTNFATSRLAGRLVSPLFQSHFAESVAKTETLPGFAEEVLAKFRLADDLTLNQTLFQRSFGGGAIGEVTGLLYGEAAAGTGSFPLVWVIVALLSLVLLYLAFDALGFPIGALIGVALWRSFQGGLANILPSLILQIVAIVVLYHPRSRRTDG
jgi:hypothetical protein